MQVAIQPATHKTVEVESYVEESPWLVEAGFLKFFDPDETPLETRLILDDEKSTGSSFVFARNIVASNEGLKPDVYRDALEYQKLMDVIVVLEAVTAM